MANIALLNRCNLKCPYCFANDYIQDEKQDITIDVFKELLDFAAPDATLGIIGGEPLLHKDFDTIMSIAQNDFRFDRITVFTNGIFIDKHLTSLNNRKTTVLINVNSKKDIGNANFERLDNNIGLLLDMGWGSNVSIGINVYEKNQDMSDLLYLIKKYRFKRLRISVVIPRDKSMGGINYFMEMKPTLLALYQELALLGVCPCYDCNAIPECVYTEKEREILYSLPFSNEFEREIFLGKRSVCSPVIDIYPDYTATRCFGCYDMDKVSIKDFESINDLKNYFFMKIDARLVHSYSRKECKNCYKHKIFGCFGGCLCYKEVKH